MPTDFRGALRTAAANVNEALEKVQETAGAPRRKAADLDEILGPVPEQQQAPAFFGFSGSSPHAADAIPTAPPAAPPAAPVDRAGLGTAPTAFALPPPEPAAAPPLQPAAREAPRPPPPAPPKGPPAPPPGMKPPPPGPPMGSARSTAAMGAPLPPPAAPAPPKEASNAAIKRPPQLGQTLLGIPAAQAAAFGSGPVQAPRKAAEPPQLMGDEDDGATMVARVPDELLAKAAQQQAESEAEQEKHFREVYEQFVATKKQCGEPTKDLTFEKFVVTLRKNRDQIVKRHDATKVRFTVYVKDGKAALKATPIRE
jgi:hypothetical protein